MAEQSQAERRGDPRGTEHHDVKPLSVPDIQEALERSGYPLEVELAAELKDLGFIPALGRHLLVDSDAREFSEIDVVAGRSAFAGGIKVGTRLLLQVKRLTDNRAFVGVRGEQPPPTENLGQRLQLAGSPSTVLAAQEHMALFCVGEPALQNALKPLLALPVCAHWAIAYRKGKDVPWASGDTEVHRDFETLVRARREAGLNFSRFCSTKVSVPALSLDLIALIVDSPLYVYDVAAKTAEPVQMLTVDQAFGTREGPCFAMIDVINRAAFGAYVKLCLEADERLQAGTEFHAEALKRAAAESHERAKAAAARPLEIPEELAGWPLR